MSASFTDAERNAQYWRRLEAEARLIASTMTDLGPKGIMLSIAEAYKRLAQHAELRDPQRLLGNAAFGPDTLRVVAQAFDAAWANISGNFREHPAGSEVACVKLATALLSVASEDSRDVNVLTAAALQRMTLDYRGV